MSARELAPGLELLSGSPRHWFNVYLAGDVVIDGATRHARRRILRQLRGHRVAAHALTHAHGDHQGSTSAICRRLRVPLWCGEGDVELMERGRPRAGHPLPRLRDRTSAGPCHPVSRALREGDEVGGFTVIETPGDSLGHLSYWRERDRTLILGDVLFGMNPLTLTAELCKPPRYDLADEGLHSQSLRRVKALRPALVCFGHGPELRDAGRFSAFIDELLG